ncbi:hypothetical protein [Qipengyuania aquimaris]|uniref:hypothetical protein n=1 Tax=Qipengyuania aquimaris TaxID=255984 RepID=UPI001CD4ADF0|nr:hypothetical protein [Qipengyuania aquimaris]MCA0902236.1 hypothetical protein [Qipengyuania aquimaris]
MTFKVVIYAVTVAVIFSVWIAGNDHVAKILVGVSLAIGAVGALAGLTSYNSSDHFAGVAIVGFALLIIALALSNYVEYARWLITAVLVTGLIAYAIPMSAWRAVGLADSESTADAHAESSDE